MMEIYAPLHLKTPPENSNNYFNFTLKIILNQNDNILGRSDIMIKLSARILSTFQIPLLLAFGLLVNTGLIRAENALQALGQAQQDQYNDSKRLGPNAPRALIKQAEERNFSRARELWKKETDELMTKYEKEGSKAMLNMVKEGFLPKLTPENTTESDAQLEPEDKTPAPVASGSKPSDTGAPTAKPSSRGTASTTGENTGAEGAQYVDFGAKEAQPKDAKAKKGEVVDGIIQTR